MATLRQHAEIIMRSLQHDEMEPVFIILERSGKLRIFDPPPGMRIAPLMNIGAAKEMIFGHFREYVRQKKCLGTIFVSEMWKGTESEKARALPTKELKKLFRGTGFNELCEKGWLIKQEAVVATCQTEETVLHLTQIFVRTGGQIVFENVESAETPQANFFGRQKMFGDLREEGIR